jgi:hypothetical protein
VIVPAPEGYMVRLPDTGTGPYPCRLTDEALATLQLSSMEPPGATLDGLAVKERMIGSDEEAGGGVGTLTTTVVEADTEYEPLVASRL